MEGTRLSNNNFNESEYDENILKYLTCYRNIENTSENFEKSKADSNGEICVDFMDYLQKNQICESGANEKRYLDCTQSLLDKELNNEKMLLEDANDTIDEYETCDLKYATNDKLLEEIENVLTNSTSKTTFLIPQSASSPKLITSAEKIYDVHSNLKAKSYVNSCENTNDSLGYHTFKSNIGSKHEDELIIENDKNIQSSTNFEDKVPSGESSSSPLIISISDDDIIFAEHQKADISAVSTVSMKSVEQLNYSVTKEFPKVENVLFSELTHLSDMLPSKLNPFQPSEERNKKSQVKVGLKKKRRNPQNKRKLKLNEQKQQRAAALDYNLNALNQLDTEIKLPSEKRIKLNDSGSFLGTNIQNIGLIYEKRKNQVPKYKPIKFVSGGIIKVSTKCNFKDIGDQLKIYKTNLENIEKYKNDIENLLKGPGGQIMEKMGYVFGKGLGKYSQGIIQPIEAHIRKGRGSIGSYGCEMLLPTSVKIQEKQYKILKSLNKTYSKTIKNDSHFQPGIYSNVFFDYSSLPNPFDLLINNNYEHHNFKFSQDLSINNYYNKDISNKSIKNTTSINGIPNIFIQIGNVEENSASITDTNSRKQLKAKRRIKVQDNPLQLIITTTSGRFNFEQFLELEENLNTVIINAALLYNISLQFEDISIEEGYIKINCTNESTYYWIENLIRNSEYGQFLPKIKLLVQSANFDSISGYKMEIFIPGKNLKTADYLRLFEIQNPGLITREWKIYKRNEIKNGVQIIIEINEKSLNTLQNVYEFRPYLALNRVQFNMVENN